MRIFFSSVAFAIVVLTYFYDQTIVSWGVHSNFSWTFSKVLPWFIVLLMSLIIMTGLVRTIQKRSFKLLIGFMLPLTLLGLMFAINPIYSADFIKKGTAREIDNHRLLEIAEAFKPNFDGIIAIVDSDCPFCRKATRDRLRIMDDRDVNIDIALTLNTADRTIIDDYIEATNSSQLDYLVHKPSEALIQLSGGVFPTFVYIKSGQIRHLWKNSELGFPALDWIESGLHE